MYRDGRQNENQNGADVPLTSSQEKLLDPEYLEAYADDLLKWTEDLDFEKYQSNWATLATSAPSDLFSGIMETSASIRRISSLSTPLSVPLDNPLADHITFTEEDIATLLRTRLNVAPSDTVPMVSESYDVFLPQPKAMQYSVSDTRSEHLSSTSSVFDAQRISSSVVKLQLADELAQHSRTSSVGNRSDISKIESF